MVRFLSFVDDRSELCERLEDCYSDWQKDDETDLVEVGGVRECAVGN